ncbi:MAG: phosphatidate cytidylyltransferase [Chitinispirillaceae bacterium]|nr:phosphatidate cytidylyltransferase [Chitinispirillaceae bacterium]
MRFSNLGKRLLFALWAIPLGWWLINTDISILPRSVATVNPVHIGIVIVIMLACYEYSRMLAILYPSNAFWLSYLWLGTQFIVYFNNDSSFPTTVSIYGLLLMVAAEAIIWGRRYQRSRWLRASLLFSGNAFLYIAAVSLMNLYREPFQALFVKFSNVMFSQLGVVIVIGAVFMCDSAAYFAGSIWGKHHFSRISPKKTVEGSLGGLIAAMLVCGIGWFFLAEQRYPSWIGILLGVIVGVFAQIGDLLVSVIKRYFRVKDASDIIPGHGGILDRFDSVFFTAPMISLFSWVVVKLFGSS